MNALRLTWASILLLSVLVVAALQPFGNETQNDAANFSDQTLAADTERVLSTALDVPTAVALPEGLPARPAEWASLKEILPDTIQEVIRFFARIGEVEFPHLMHVDDFGMECVECHHETHATSLDIPHQDYFDDFWIDCGSCHKSNGDTVLGPQACSDCHHSDPTGIADESLSSKVVIHRLCWDCHDSGTGVEASESCVSCHFGEKTSFIEPLPASQRSH